MIAIVCVEVWIKWEEDCWFVYIIYKWYANKKRIYMYMHVRMCINDMYICMHVRMCI
jgi:hypothetical protein